MLCFSRIYVGGWLLLTWKVLIDHHMGQYVPSARFDGERTRVRIYGKNYRPATSHHQHKSSRLVIQMYCSSGTQTRLRCAKPEDSTPGPLSTELPWTPGIYPDIYLMVLWVIQLPSVSFGGRILCKFATEDIGVLILAICMWNYNK